MKKFDKIIFLACGLLLTLAAFPVFAQKNTELNKKPLRDFADLLNQKIADKKVDLNAPFSVELELLLTDKGRIDAKKSKFTRSEGDKQIIEVVTLAIDAVNDSGMFAFLKGLGFEKANLALSQNNEDFSAILSSEQSTSQNALTVSSGLNFLIKLAFKADADGKRKLDEDEKMLLTGLKILTNDKKVVLSFSSTKSAFQEMITRNLEDDRDIQ